MVSVMSILFQVCCPKGSVAPPLDLPLCEGDNIDKYNDYYYDDDYDGIDSLGCVAPKSKESKRAFTYNSETECDDYPGTKCKLGNQCGAKGTKTWVYQNNHETLKMWNDGRIIVSSQKIFNYMKG